MSQNNNPPKGYHTSKISAEYAKQRQRFYGPVNTTPGSTAGAEGTSASLQTYSQPEIMIKQSQAHSMSSSDSATFTPASQLEQQMLSEAVSRHQEANRPDQPLDDTTEQPPSDTELVQTDVNLFGEEIEQYSSEEEEDRYEDEQDNTQTRQPLSAVQAAEIRLMGVMSYEFFAFLTHSEGELRDIIFGLTPLVNEKVLHREELDLINYLSTFSNHLVLLLFMINMLADKIYPKEIVNIEVKRFISGYIKWESPNIQKHLNYNDARWQKLISNFKYDEKAKADELAVIPSFYDMDVELNEADTLSIRSAMESKSHQGLQSEILVCKTLIRLLPELEARIMPKPKRAATVHNEPVSQTVPTIRLETPSPWEVARPQSPGSDYVYKSTTKFPRIKRDIYTASTSYVEQEEMKVETSRVDKAINEAVAKSGDNSKATDYYYTTAVEMPGTESDDEEFTNKYGDNCVHTVDTVDTDLTEASVNQPSTIIGVMSNIVNASYGNYNIINNDEVKARRIGNRISLPDEKAPYRETYVSDSTPAFVHKVDALRPFKIQATGRVDLKTTVTLPSTFGVGVVTIDTRKLTVALQSIVPGLSRFLAEGVAPLAITDQTRYGMLSFFTRAWAIHYMLVTCEEFDIQPRFINLVAGDITNIIADVTQQTAADQIRAFTAAITRGDTVLTTTETSPVDLECMRLISAGTSCVHTPENSPWALIGSNFTWDEPVFWGVLGAENTQREVPANINVTAGQLRAFILRVSELLDRAEDTVNGYIRACVLMTGRVKRIRHGNGKVESFYVNSMLEMYGTILPASWSDNPLWRLQREQTKLTVGASYPSELRYLHLQVNPYFGHMSVLIGQFISLGFSNVLHTFNLTGNNLTSVSRNNAGAVSTDLIQGLIVARPSSMISIFSLLACGYYPQISPICVNPNALMTPKWSAFGVLAAAANPTVSWNRMFPDRIPYIVQPAAILYVGVRLDSNWGLSQPGVKGEFKNELQQYDDQRHLMWNASNGDANYLSVAKTDKPYFYLPYGLFALNSIMQETRTHVREQKFVAIKRISASGATPLAGFPAAWDVYRPQYIPNLFTMYAGTFLTYDWAQEAVMSPALVLEEQPQIIADMLECDSMTLFRKAGLRYRDARTFTTLNTNISDAIAAPRPKSASTAGATTSLHPGAMKALEDETRSIEARMQAEAEKQEAKAKKAAMSAAKAAEKQASNDIPGADEATPKA